MRTRRVPRRQASSSTRPARSGLTSPTLRTSRDDHGSSLRGGSDGRGSGPMSRRFSMHAPEERIRGLSAAADAVRRGDLVVLPTDTVYGVGADAFASGAVARLLDAKGRGRDVPVPVLVGSPATLEGLATALPQWGRDLVEAFWPGALTVVCRQQPSLSWDLGDTRGTVAIRMPLHPVAIELLRDVGPMAVSSANHRPVAGHHGNG